MRRRWLLLLPLIAACGSPTAPQTPATLPLREATYRFVIMPFPFGCGSGDPVNFVPPHSTLLRLAPEQGAFVGRPATRASGEFELRLEPTRRGDASATPLRGTFAGVAISVGVPPLASPAGMRVEAAPGTPVEGVADNLGRGAFGFFSAPLTFRDERGAITCPPSSLRWQLLLEPQ